MKGRKNKSLDRRMAGAGVFALGLAALLRSAIADNPPSFGEHFRILTAAELAMFDVREDDFEEVETPPNGFPARCSNNTSCAACRSSPAVGATANSRSWRHGSGVATTRSSTRWDPSGGSLIQSQGIDPDPTSPCAAETVPGDANVVAQRKSTPLLGLGLVNHSVPDEVLEELAKSQKHQSRDVAGDTHKVKDVASGKMRVGRFGWKAQVATLRTFAGDAYLNEMRITNPLFPSENAPGGSSREPRRLRHGRRSRRRRHRGAEAHQLHDPPRSSSARPDHVRGPGRRGDLQADRLCGATSNTCLLCRATWFGCVLLGGLRCRTFSARSTPQPRNTPSRYWL